MKGVLSGLGNLKKVAENQPQGGSSSFLKLEGGQSVTVRFLQELDTLGKNYDEERGLAISLFEHTNPDDFKQRFLCTNEDEGKCVGCERVVANSRWKRRSRLYINAWIEEEGAVKIIPTGFSSKGIGNTLIEFFEDFGTLCDRTYKLKRVGEGLKTSYSIYPREISDFKYEGKTVFDLENLLAKYRTYDECLALVEGREEQDSW